MGRGVPEGGGPVDGVHHLGEGYRRTSQRINPTEKIMPETKIGPKIGERPGEVIGIIEKGRTVDLRIGLKKYENRVYLDVRQFIVTNATGDRKPTRKGVTLPLDKIPELRSAIAAVHREAMKTNEVTA